MEITAAIVNVTPLRFVFRFHPSDPSLPAREHAGVGPEACRINSLRFGNTAAEVYHMETE